VLFVLRGPHFAGKRIQITKSGFDTKKEAPDALSNPFENKEVYRGQEYDVDLLPKVKLEISSNGRAF
jgi:hypothetical protein